MEEIQFNKSIRVLSMIIYSMAIITTFIVMTHYLYIGIVLFILFVILAYFLFPLIKKWQANQFQMYEKLAYKVQNVGNEVFHNLPFGIIIYNDQGKIEWVNQYIHTLYEQNKLLGKPVAYFSDQVSHAIQQEIEETTIEYHHIHFQVTVDHQNRAVYLFDRTMYYQLKSLYEKDRLVIATIYLDNYDEISRNMEDNLKSQINSEITAKLTKWADNHNFYVKRTSQDRFMAILTEDNLQTLEEANFQILDEIRQMHVEKLQRNPITLSIGVGTGNVPINELASLAQSSLDLVLGRGGDQVAIRHIDGTVRFYGGKTNPMEKRTRVRARVISHALADLVKESENVIIMGHQSPDMDALGSAIGVLKIAQSNGIDGYIIYDEEDVVAGIKRAIDMIKTDGSLWKYFIGRQEAEEIFTKKSLVVVVDTHRPNNVAHPFLLQQAERKVIIDHHRRGEEFIEEATLVYMEPYASSTAELVTELIEYQPNKIQMSTLEATTLLAGIIVDTKSFALRTGSRTFDAASYLRIKGADPTLTQQFLKEDLQTFVKRSKLIENASIYDDSIAIVRAQDDVHYSHIMVAQAADTLLTMDNIKATFVIARLNEEQIAISARSLGDVNVQVIMEQLHGGGHLTNAATQLKDISTDEAEVLLRDIITQNKANENE